MRRTAVLVLLWLAALGTARPADLFNGKNLDGWESAGDGIWTVMRDGTLVGQRDIIKNQPDLSWTKPQYSQWLYRQAWLYTRKDFNEFDLHLEYWLRWGGNSGISIRDTSRGAYAVATPPDFTRTPSKIGYEIQLANHYPDNTPSGSIYGFAKARTGYEHEDDWNSIDIEVRSSGIRVRLNGELVAEHPGDPKRPKTGPIGLQIHDQYTVVMFRNIRIEEK
jgi:hypothetical protein